MIDETAERKQDKATKPQFIFTGFTQTAGIRIYAFEGTVDVQRIHFTVTVDLQLIPGYGIRIQDLPLLCRELLQRRVEPDAISAFVFTEQEMRSHSEKLTTAREEAERKKKPRPVPNTNPVADWRSNLR